MMQLQPRLSHVRYRPDIDGLRAIAVLSVVAFHAFPNWMKGGFIGVDVFFVISGYLISTIIFENLERETFSFSEFYGRRVKRIFPALLVVLIACYALGWFVLLADEYKQLGKHIAAGAGFVSNFILWNEAGYFDNSAQTKPLLHLWSLGIEEQFYIVWPVTLWIAWRRKYNLLIITFLIAVISFGLNFVKKDVVAAFYSPQTRFWELLCGGLLSWVSLYSKRAWASFRPNPEGWLAKAIQRGEDQGETLSNVVSFVGCFLLLYGFWRIDKDTEWWAVVPVLGAVLIIWAGSMAWVNRTILSNRIAVWFGLISFPLYLWHWPLLSFARIAEGEVPSRNIRVGSVILSVVLAWLTYNLVERSIRLGEHGRAKVAALVVLMILVGYISYDTSLRGGVPFRMPQLETNMSQLNYVSPNNELCKIKHPFALFGTDPARVGVLTCYESEKKYPESVYLVGDSHMDALTLGFKRRFDDGDFKYNITAIGRPGCLPFLNVESIPYDGSAYGCASVINSTLHDAMRREDVKWVILVGRHAARFNGSLFGDIEKEDSAKPWSYRYESRSIVSIVPSDVFELGLKETLDQLIKSGKKVIFVHQLPELGFDPRRCIARFRKLSQDRTCSISRDVVELRVAPYKKAVSRIVSERRDVTEYDPIGLVCNNSSCEPFNAEGELMYRDNNHMSGVGSEYIAKEITNLILKD